MLTRGEAEDVEYTLKWLCWISLFLAVGVGLTYLVFKRRYPHALLLCFALCSALLPAFLLLSFLPGGAQHVQESYLLCQFQGIGIQFWGSAMVWWWFCIGCNLYLIVVKELPSTKKYFRYFHLLAWSFAVIQTAVPLFAKRIGPAGFWCWIRDDYYNAWAFACFYGVMASLSLVGLIFWCRVIWKMTSYHLSGSILQGYLVRHICFVLMFIVVFAVMVTHRIYQAVHHDNSIYPLIMAHAVVLGGQGIVVFVCFGMTKDNGKLWLDLTRRCGKRMRAWCRKERDRETLGFSDDEDEGRPINSVND